MQQTSRPLPAVKYGNNRNPFKGSKAQTDGLNNAWFSKFPVSRKPDCRLCANAPPTPVKPLPVIRSFIERKSKEVALRPHKTRSSRRLLKLKPGKESGNDHVGPRYIRKVEPVLSQRATFLYHAIIKYGHFPSTSKEGHILALKKLLKKDQRYIDLGP
jgi:hypothetical protein